MTVLEKLQRMLFAEDYRLERFCARYTNDMMNHPEKEPLEYYCIENEIILVLGLLNERV